MKKCIYYCIMYILKHESYNILCTYNIYIYNIERTLDSFRNQILLILRLFQEFLCIIIILVSNTGYLFNTVEIKFFKQFSFK